VFPPRRAALHAVRPAKPPAAPSVAGSGARPRTGRDCRDGRGHATRRRVRRAQGATTSGSRSVKIRRGHGLWAPIHLRTRSCQRTRAVPQGRSASVRVSRLWTRAVQTVQTGQGASFCGEVTGSVSSVAVSSSCHEWSGSAVVSGQKCETTVIASMEETKPIWPIPRQQYTPGWPYRTPSPKVAKSRVWAWAPSYSHLMWVENYDVIEQTALRSRVVTRSGSV
jgi:hypothetical protein